MESKFVSKAKSALAKAERVFTDIKADFVAEFSSQGEVKGELPWIGHTDKEKSLQAECQKRIFEISKTSNFLDAGGYHKANVDMAAARAVLELDENLLQLRHQYVPQRMKEKEFWRRYFDAVERVKEELYRQAGCSSISSPDLGSLGSGESIDAESPRKDPAEEEAYKNASTIVSIPPSVLVRRLAAAASYAKTFETMKDLAAVTCGDKDWSQGGDWPSLASGLVRRLSSGEKDSRSKSQKYRSSIWSLFDADAYYGGNAFELTNKAKFPEELHGAPPASFVAQLAEVIAGLKTEHHMAEFWLEILKEFKRRWEDGQPIPRVSLDGTPDLKYCLLHQQLQAINCCIARRKRRASAISSMNVLQEHQSNGPRDSSMLFAKLKDGSLAPRLGVDQRDPNLNLLETGEPVYSPITQEGPVLTENSIKETEELMLRTGSFGAGCSQLFSDMQAFKAANPGCILEDFVRWYSPLDWKKEPESPVERTAADRCLQEQSLRGHLSTRMKCEGNLWQELWVKARPLPAVMQAPLFDEELAGETVLDELESIIPADFFEQLFTAALSAGFAIAAPSVSKDLSAGYFKEYQDYVISTCHRNMKPETLEDLCQVYELMEAATHVRPEELAANVQKQVAAKVGGRKSGSHLVELGRFLTNRQPLPQPEQPEPAGHMLKGSSDGPVSSVVRFFETKASLFERKSKQAPAGGEQKNVAENDWALV